MATVQEKIELMHAKKEHIMQGGGAARIEKQHAKGKQTARERIAKLFEAGTQGWHMFSQRIYIHGLILQKMLPQIGKDLFQSWLQRQITQQAVLQFMHQLMKRRFIIEFSGFFIEQPQ